MRDGLILKSYQGEEIRSIIAPLAHLRITVFREFPYLYDGTEAYEADYLARYAKQPHALVGLAWAGDQVVGATTAQPLACEMEAVQAPFHQTQRPVANYLYFGESLVLAACRGMGLGHAFFDLREEHARRLGLSHTTFCAVDRPADHPLKPDAYRPNDAFWTKRGYVRHPELTCQMTWQDIDQPTELAHTLTFWIK